MDKETLTQLDYLEAESIHIIQEVVAEIDKTVLLYSIGKDSAVLLHLIIKAFYPQPIPFPLLHIDTGWKFKDMISFRNKQQKRYGFELIAYTNPEGIKNNINPFDHPDSYTDIMKTQALKQALDKYGFEAAFGGARRDEEKSRAKERILSFRNMHHAWDPKNQRPELWSTYNMHKRKGESIRVFPLSNWTELDIWHYIHRENIDIVPLYYAAKRPVLMREGGVVMVDDERMPVGDNEQIMYKNIRFRTLGCYPLTAAIESQAQTLQDIIQEMRTISTSERMGRIIDKDAGGSMEQKKRQGYF